MKRSDEDIDRLLRDWDRVAATAQPPAEAPRRSVRTASALPVTAALVGVLAIVGVALIVPRQGGPGPAGVASTSPATTADASSSVPASVEPSSPTDAAPTPTPAEPSDAGLVASATVHRGPFRFGLSVDETTYADGAVIKPVATAVYEGPQEKVTVGHASSPVWFSVREVGGTREAIGGVDTICDTSTWSRNKTESFPWERSGSYSTSDPTPNDRFVETYLGNGRSEGLRLPAGTWDLVATFDVNVGGCGRSNAIDATIRIRVLPSALEASPTLPPSGSALGPVVRCLRVRPADCEGAVSLAHDLWPDAYDVARLVLVVDSCTSNAVCDRLYPFDALVVFLPNPGTPMGQTVLVHGFEGPESAEPTQTAGMMTDELDELARQGFDDGNGGTLFPVRVSAPVVDPSGACRLARIGGTLGEVPESGMGLDGRAVTWPFGWAGRRSAAGVQLITLSGRVIGSIGDPFEGTGSPATSTVCGTPD